jgi:hypothetical protein
MTRRGGKWLERTRCDALTRREPASARQPLSRRLGTDWARRFRHGAARAARARRG